MAYYTLLRTIVASIDLGKKQENYSYVRTKPHYLDALNVSYS